MKKYTVVTPQTMTRLAQCFSSSEEIETFVSQMEGAMTELKFMSVLREKVPESDSGYVLLKQICIFVLFCREHMDLIHQLVSKMQCRQVTEEELNRMMDERD